MSIPSGTFIYADQNIPLFFREICFDFVLKKRITRFLNVAMHQGTNLI